MSNMNFNFDFGPNIYQPQSMSCCITCARFHFGVCPHLPRDCWTCGKYGHIQRYCKPQRTLPWHIQDSMPGFDDWCRLHGITDHRAIRQLQNSMEMNPGASVYVDDKLLYEGVKLRFFTGRSAEATMIDRYISPGSPLHMRLANQEVHRQYHVPDLKLPLKRTFQSMATAQHPFSQRIYRSIPSTKARSVTPANRDETTDSPLIIDLISEPDIDAYHKRTKTHHPKRSMRGAANRESDTHLADGDKSKIMEDLVPLARQPLFDISLKVPMINHNIQLDCGDRAEVPCLGDPIRNGIKENALKTLENDPCSVLGITERAEVAEIQDAYFRRVAEINAERTTGFWDADDIHFDESIALINEARRQLLGY